MSLPLSHVDEASEIGHLLQRIAGHDQDAMLTLYQKYGNLVFSLALRVLQKAELAEETTQDVFLKFWQQPQRWNPALGGFSTWLLTVTHHAAIDRLRKERTQTPHHVETPDILATIEQMPNAPGFADDPLWYDGQVLRRLMRQLPLEQQQIIELAFWAGYTHSELAQVLNLPLGTVKTRLRLGLQRLKLLWEEEAREQPSAVRLPPALVLLLGVGTALWMADLLPPGWIHLATYLRILI